MAEHSEPRVGLRQGEPQQRVATDRRAQRAGVVAELADLRRSFVDEPHALPGDAHRAVLEQRIMVAFGEHALHTRIRQRQPVTPHEQVQAGRVAAAHLEAVERRQGLLHGEVTGNRRNRAVEAGKGLDLACGSQTIEPHRPGRVAKIDQLRGNSLLLVRVRRLAGVDLALRFFDAGVELVEPGGYRGGQLVAPEEGTHTGYTLQQLVTAAHGHGCCGEAVGGDCLVEMSQDLGGVRHLST